jgi:hypothetical protein
MMTIFSLVVDLVATLARLAPDVVTAVQAIVASGASPDEQRAALEALKAKLSDDVGRVTAVQFRDV